MSTTKHTPGPWYVVTDPGEGPRIHNGVRTSVVSVQGVTICDNEPYYPKDLDPNNAHLIAAAPDLLECLEDLLVIAEQHLKYDGCETQNARLAINKAKGITE